ncbi:MAG: cell division protein ZapE, partial [Rickettsiales bacterium]
HVHNKLRDFKNTHNKISLLVDYFQKSYKHIVIDELEILDITDAMLMREIIPKLCKEGIKVYFSTNTKPEDLYPDGIQRNSFIPFISFVNKEFLVEELSSKNDYRRKIICERIKSRYLTPNNKTNNYKLQSLFRDISENKLLDSAKFKINNRSFNVIDYSNTALLLDFEQFFTSNCSTKDFEKITKKYKYFFVLNIRPIGKDERNLIKRFINFIDLLYVEKKLLFLTSSVDVEKIYKSGIYLKEFDRTKSRLTEIKNMEMDNG